MRILIAEDDPVSRQVLATRLRNWGDEVIACPDGTSAWEALQKPDAPKLAILDWMMPGLDGLEVCRRVRGLTGRAYSYLLLLTARSQREDVVAGLEAGADDYLTKPVDLNELRARLRAGHRILELQDQLLAAQEELRHRASHDALTGLWNRAAILEILGRELARTGRDQSPLGVIMADLDHFKRINDTLGHLAGDGVLREAAGRLRRALRQSDWIGRYGGEEFLIVLPGADVPQVLQGAERLRLAVASAPITLPEGSLTATLSMGVATAADAWHGDVGQLLRVADAALYRAKQAGRNRVELGTLGQLATPPASPSASERALAASHP
jgi:diguanylate cyclase (GGDEF)-like protein